jgi:hypothetical protein
MQRPRREPRIASNVGYERGKRGMRRVLNAISVLVVSGVHAKTRKKRQSAKTTIDALPQLPLKNKNQFLIYDERRMGEAVRTTFAFCFCFRAFA